MKKNIITPLGQFPKDVLPASLQILLNYVKVVSQAPESLIVSLIFSIMGLACQDLVIAQVHEKLQFQVTLYLIVIASSGDRKSFVFKLLTSSILELQEQLDKEYDEKLKKFNGDVKIWRLKESAVDKEYREAIKNGSNTDVLEKAIRLLQESKPVLPCHIKLILNDVTTAAIKKQLGSGNESFAIMDDEAGRLFKMDFLNETSVLNSLWSGGRIVKERGVGAGVKIDDARLGLTLMVQPKIFYSFLSKNGEMLRDNGFLARCLIVACESTQGTRLNSSALPLDDGELKWFNERVATLLMQGVARRSKGEKSTIIQLSKEALVYWNSMCCQLEGHLAAGEQLEAYRDYASKFPEQVIRLAAVIEVFLNGSDSEVSLESMEAGYHIANWYFDHFIHLMSSCDCVGVKSNAKLLDEWLYQKIYVKGVVSIEKNAILQGGPVPLRKACSLNETLNQLELDGRVRVYKSKGTTMVEYVQARQLWECKNATPALFLGGVDCREHKFVSYEESIARKAKDPLLW